MPHQHVYSPALNPPFKPSLNPARPSMALMPLTTTGYRLLPLPQHSPGPYKRRAPPPEHPTPFPLALELSLTFLCSHTELKLPPLFAIVAPPLHRRLCSIEHPSSTASSCLSSSSHAGEHQRSLAPLRHTPMKRRRTRCPCCLLVHHELGRAADP
jgi:hypothetical protein